MPSYQETKIIGHLGQDPELKYMQSGTAICNFSVAVSESWNDRQTNERKEKTTWYRVNVWGKQGENANQYLSKGSAVMVIGNVEARAYMGKDGQPAASLDLRAFRVLFLDKKGSGQKPDNVVDYKPEASQSGDDIPF